MKELKTVCSLNFIVTVLDTGSALFIIYMYVGSVTLYHTNKHVDILRKINIII